MYVPELSCVNQGEYMLLNAECMPD